MGETHPLPRQALLFLAAVDEARKTKEGPFRAIAPIFAVGVEAQRGSFLDKKKTVYVLSQILGEQFNEDVLDAFIPQLVKLGWLSEERIDGGQAIYTVSKDIELDGSSSCIDSIQEKIKLLYSAFKEFHEEKVPLLPLEMDESAFGWNIFQWAVSLDGIDKTKIQKAAEGFIRGQSFSFSTNGDDEIQRSSKIKHNLSILFAGFVSWLVAGKRKEISLLASLTELGLAVEFIEEITKCSLDNESKIDTIFFFDAPIILDMLGLSGESRMKGVLACVNVIKSRGGRFATLSHCVEEAKEILDTILKRPQLDRYGLTSDAMRADPTVEQRARVVAHRPDRAVKNLGVDILVPKWHSPNDFIYFPEELIDSFRKRANWHDPTKIEQRQRDAESIAYIMRRRNKSVSSEVFNCTAIFVTKFDVHSVLQQVYSRELVDIKLCSGPCNRN